MTPNTSKVGKVTRAQLEEIAKDQGPGPDRRRSGCGRAHDRRQRPQHGHRRGGRLTWPNEPSAPRRIRKRYRDRHAVRGRTMRWPWSRNCASAKFDESVDVAVNLGVDPRKSDQVVRGSDRAAARHRQGGPRRRVRAGRQRREGASAAGADVVGIEDLAEQMKGGDLNFDTVIATPDAMRVVGQLGRVLGPRGLMPNPKVGTVTQDVETAVQECQGPARCVSVPTRPASCIARSARPISKSTRCGKPERIAGRPEQGQAGVCQGSVPEADVGVVDHGPGRAGRSRRSTRGIDTDFRSHPAAEPEGFIKFSGRTRSLAHDPGAKDRSHQDRRWRPYRSRWP